MNRRKRIILLLVTLTLGVIGYSAGYSSGYFIGQESGRVEKIEDIRENIWRNELLITSRDLENTTLVIIRQIRHPDDSDTPYVTMRKVARIPGLSIKEVYTSPYSKISGAFYISIWELKNQSDTPINISDSSFLNLPDDFKIDERFHEDAIIIQPSEQAAPSNR